jgi:LysM repeat protein
MPSRLSGLVITVALFALVPLTAPPAHATPTTTEPTLPVQVTPAPATPKWHTVVVKSGDTLSSIARRAHLSSWRPIYDANRFISNQHRIFPGWKLRVPSPGVRVRARALPKTVVKAVSRVAPTRTRVSTSGDNVSGGVWDRIAQCESGGNWHINTGNGYYGGLQFDLTSWRRVGGTGLPSDASKSEQIMRAEALQRLQGWGSWPVCAAFMR